MMLSGVAGIGSCGSELFELAFGGLGFGEIFEFRAGEKFPVSGDGVLNAVELLEGLGAAEVGF